MAAAKEGSTSQFDIFQENRWLFLLVGFAPRRNLCYMLYVVLLVSIQLYVQAMAFYAIYLLSSRASLIFDALHVVSASWFAVWGLSIRFMSNRSLLTIADKIKEGIYKYEGEEVDEKEEEMKAGIPAEIRWKSNAIVFMYAIGFSSNTIFFPVSQYLLLDEAAGEGRPDFLSPYISHVFYSPFDTRSPLGYAALYVIDFLFILFIYVIAVSLNRLYISCTVCTKVHLQILGHSLSNLPRRAALLYSRLHGQLDTSLSLRDLLARPAFHDCLYFCLRSNVRHHQTLLRFKQTCSILIGSIVLEVFALAGIVYASILYEMYQDLPANVHVNYLLTSLAEQTYTFFICSFGEELIGESMNVYSKLYGIEWYEFDSRFKKALGIMLANSKKPIDFRALVMSVPASMETYAESLACVYKIMNLARHSDVLH